MRDVVLGNVLKHGLEFIYGFRLLGTGKFLCHLFDCRVADKFVLKPFGQTGGLYEVTQSRFFIYQQSIERKFV